MAYWGGRRLYGAFARYGPTFVWNGPWVRGHGPLQSARKVAMENRTLAEREFGNI
jgi:hypothetical protein